MPNTFNHVGDSNGKWLALESLDLLVNKLAVSPYFNTDYSKEFKLKFPVGDTIRVPYPELGTIRNGLTYNPAPLSPRYATVEVFEPFGIDFELDSIETALFTPRQKEEFSKRIIEPKMAQLAQEIDSRCALWAYQHAASVVGALGTNPSTYDATSAAALQVMTELGCPDGEKGIILPPSVHRAVKTANIALRNPVENISKQFRKGYVEQADDFDWYRSMSLYRHTAATWAGAVTLTSAPANGATTLSLTCTNGDTFKKGDKLSIANALPVNHMTKRTFSTTAKTFSIISADQTISGTSATITVTPAIYFEGPHQNVDSQPAASAALTLWPGTTSPNGKAGIVGLALHRNAFGLVGIELEEFKDVEICQQKRDPESGLAIRFTRASDARASKKINRFDVAIGMGDFYNDSCAVAVACG